MEERGTNVVVIIIIYIWLAGWLAGFNKSQLFPNRDNDCLQPTLADTRKLHQDK